MVDPLSSSVKLSFAMRNVVWSHGSVGAQMEEWLRRWGDA